MQGLFASLLASPVSADYLIGPGDTLEIFVWRNPDLTITVPVRPDGKISTPLVGAGAASPSLTVSRWHDRPRRGAGGGRLGPIPGRQSPTRGAKRDRQAAGTQSSAGDMKQNLPLRPGDMLVAALE